MNNALNSWPANIRIENGAVTFPGVEVIREAKPCHLVIDLNWIYYGGDDVGANWKFDANVYGGTWTSGRVTLHPGQALPVNRTLFDGILSHGCGTTLLLNFFVRAREYDFFIFDDIGERLDITPIQCKPEISRVEYFVFVRVTEYPAWWRQILRLHSRVATLIYSFTIQTQCKS